MKIGEQCLYLAQLKGLGKRDAFKKLKQWFQQFEIEHWWDKKVEDLSKGMAQKVQFISTVIHEPKLLIFWMNHSVDSIRLMLKSSAKKC